MPEGRRRALDLQHALERRTPPAPQQDNWWCAGTAWDPLPRVVLVDRHLGHTSKLVYPVVCGLSKRSGWNTMSVTMIGDMFGLARDVIDDALVCLVHAGLFECQRRPGTSHKYRPTPLVNVYDDEYRAALQLLVMRAHTDLDRIERAAAIRHLEQAGDRVAATCPSCASRNRTAPSRLNKPTPIHRSRRASA